MECTYRLANSMDSSKFKVLNDKFNGPNCNSIEIMSRYFSNPSSEIVFVAEDNDHLVGFCCCQLIKSVCYETYSLEITELYIEESYQRQGVGSELLVFIEGYFRNKNVRKIELLTSMKNIKAHKFYEQLGYVKTEQIHYKKYISE